MNKSASLNRIYLYNLKADVDNNEAEQETTTLGVAGSLKVACVYIGTDGRGQAAIEQSEGSSISLTGEALVVDGSRKIMSISGTEDDQIPVLNMVENYNVQVGTKIMIDNRALDNVNKIKLYKNAINEGNELSFYIDGTNVYSGR